MDSNQFHNFHTAGSAAYSIMYMHSVSTSFRPYHTMISHVPSEIYNMALHCLANKLLSGPRFNKSVNVPLSTIEPPSMTMMRSANLPLAHRLEVKSTATPVVLRAVMNLASSISLICEVASSSNRIDPIMHLFTVSGEESWFSFPDIN